MSPKSILFLCVFLSSECLGSQQTMLAELCEQDQSATGSVDLVSLLYWPLLQLHQYSRVLLKLAACYDVVRRKLFSLFVLLLSVCAFTVPLLFSFFRPSFTYSFSKFLIFP